jgi:hypothetical protein
VATSRTFLTTGPGAGGLAPSVVTLSAGVSPGGDISLNGTVNPNGLATTAFFQWGTDPAFGSFTTTDPVSTGAGSSSVGVSSVLPPLTPGVTYYYRMAATNSAGTTLGSVMTVTSSGPGEPGESGDPPTLVLSPVSAITTTGARFAGTVDSNGSATMVWFEWSTDPAFGTSEASSPQSVGSGTTAVGVGFDATGLLPGTTYYVRMVASNPWGTVRTPPSAPFQTLGTGGAGAPTAVTEPASGVGPTTARLNGLVNPQGVAGEWWFEWSESPTLSTLLATPAQPLAAGTTPVGVFHDLTTLGAAQPYYFRVVVSTPSTTVRGAIVGFETAAAPDGALPPVVTTFAPFLPAPGLMKLGGRVDTRGLAGVGWFEWGTDPTMSTFTRTPDQALPATTDSTAIYETLTGIPSGVTYYVRIVASTAGGLTRGTLVSVTIP